MTLNVFGDSITVGSGTGADPWYSEIIANILDTTVNNYGINGAQMADIINPIYENTKQDSLLLSGFNDYRFFGSSTVDYQKVLECAIVYLASGQVIKGQTGTLTGSWVNAGAYGGNITTTTSTVGDTAVYSVTGTCVYIALTQINNGSGGLAQISIDGNIITSCGCYGNSTANSGQNYSPTMLRFTGLSAGPHTVEIKNISTGSNKTIFIDFVASNYPGNALIVGETLKCTTANYTLGYPTFSNGSDAIVADYNAVIDSMTKYAADGLNIKIAKMLYNPNTQSVPGNAHPTTAGQCNIALCFLNNYVPGWGT